MTIGDIIELISTLGFPIACVVVMGAFIYKIYKKSEDREERFMVRVQERSKEREDILYKEIKENREINAKAINTIAYYAEKLDSIQDDIKEIKTDITVIMSKN